MAHTVGGEERPSALNASDPIALNMILDDIETMFIEPGEQQ